MKRSEMNAVAKARHEFSLEYECVSTVLVDANGDRCECEPSDECECTDAEEYFSHSGCDICPEGLAATVIDVAYRSRKDIDAKRFDKIHEGQLCGGCLCALVNGDDSDLDYSTTDEDEPKWKPEA